MSRSSRCADGSEGRGCVANAAIPRWNDAPLAQEIFLLNNVMQRVADRLVAHRGLTASRWLLMAALEHFEHDPTLTELSNDGLMTLQNVSRLVGAMAKDGLVDRYTVRGTGRAVRVRLTESGERVCEQTEREAALFTARFLDGVSDEELVVTGRVIDRLLLNMLAFERELDAGDESVGAGVERGGA